MLTFDYTINVSHVVAVIGVVWGLWKHQQRTMVQIRDQTDAVVAATKVLQILLGTKNPPDGLVGDVESIKRLVRRHNDWLIELNANAGSPVRMERS